MSLRVCEVRDFREAEVAVPMGKVGSVSLSTCHKMCSCCFARQAWHFLIFHMCEVRDLCEAKVAVPMGKVAKIRLRGLRAAGPLGRLILTPAVNNKSPIVTSPEHV